MQLTADMSLPVLKQSNKANGPQKQSAILLAALSLSGISCAIHAQEMPIETNVSFKTLNYQESQLGLKRIGVHSQALSIVAPIASDWSLDTTLVSDQVSGASPRYHTAISSASTMSDNRTGADVRITKHFQRSSIGLGTLYSNEHDYLSHAQSLQYSVATEDNNTRVTIGTGFSSDKIKPTNRSFTDTRKTRDLLLSVSQVITPQDVIQVTLNRMTGAGYFSEPYKSLDVRPRERNQQALVFKWNHFYTPTETSIRMQYRYYRDSFQIRSNTITTEFAQALNHGWVLTPLIRLYSQTAAKFYFEPDYTFLFIPKGYQVGSDQFITMDQRLSAFGGRSVGLKIAKSLADGWNVDLKFERYQQRSDWTFFKNKGLKLDQLNINQWQLGISKSY